MARAHCFVACLAAIALAGVPAAFAASSLRVATYLGTGMVLRANDTTQALWGTATAGVQIKATIDNTVSLSATTNSNGAWRIPLPAMPAGGPHTVSITSEDGGVWTAEDVQFGIVLLCSGQSNMDMPVSYAFNSSAEIAAGALYPSIRYKYIAVNRSDVPLPEFPTPPAPWVAANASATAIGGWSAICWFTGRDVYNGLGTAGMPVGLVHSALGGTPIQAWTPPSAAALCPNATNNFPESVLFNAMVAPLATPGAALFDAVLWYQGEQNAEAGTDGQGFPYYACALPALVDSWRTLLHMPEAGFFAAQLHPWNATLPSVPTLTAVPLMRLAQASLARPLTAVVPAIDGGDPLAPATSIHPRCKQTPSARLAAAALAVTFGRTDVRWRAPIYASAVASRPTANAATGAVTLTVTVSFDADTVAGGGLAYVAPNASSVSSRCPTDLGIPAYLCSGFAVQLAATPPSSPLNGQWVEAAASIGGTDRTQLVLQAVVAGVPNGVTLTANATSYGYSAWPLVNFYAAATDLPLMPWLEAVAATTF